MIHYQKFFAQTRSIVVMGHASVRVIMPNRGYMPNATLNVLGMHGTDIMRVTEGRLQRF